MITRFFRAFIPQLCSGCHQQLGGEIGLCASCRQALKPTIEEYSSLQRQRSPHLVTLGRYQGIQRRAIRTFKYKGARDLAQPLGQALGKAVPRDWQIQAVIAVPLHPRRERERGYNQAQLLALHIADILEVPCVNAISRTHWTGQQAKRGAHRELARNPFEVTGHVPPGNLLLVDDVLTTGNTLRACRDVLQQVGAECLKYAVVAH